MKIYTRTGDRGDTGLFGGQRVRKDNVRVEAYGAVDELNSVIGLALAHLDDPDGNLRPELEHIQNDLFAIGANLATPRPEDGGRESAHVPKFSGERVSELERAIDTLEGGLEPLKHFILPGGSDAAATLHLARTVCRRTERRAVTLARDAHIDTDIVVFLNRLSDYLFSAARTANRLAGTRETEWIPGERGA